MTVLLPLTIDYRHSNIWSPVVQNGPPQWQKLSPPCLNQAKQNYNKEKPWNKVLGVCRDRGEKHGLHCTQLCQLALRLNEQLEVMFFCLFFGALGILALHALNIYSKVTPSFHTLFRRVQVEMFVRAVTSSFPPSTKLHPQCHRLLCRAAAFVYLSIFMHLSKVLMATFSILLFNTIAAGLVTCAFFWGCIFSSR